MFLTAIKKQYSINSSVNKKIKYKDFNLEYTIEHGVHHFTAYKNGEYAGELQVVDDATGHEGKWYVLLIEVEKEYRRQGLASFMYDWAEKILKGPLAGSVDQTPDAVALWKSRNNITASAKAKRSNKLSSNNPVGKHIGGATYLHVKYRNLLKDYGFEEASAKIPKGFKYNIIKYNHKTGDITFINSPDFDTADEPKIGDAVLVKKDGTVRHMKEQKDPWIYHHKWTMVRPDYKGFDAKESEERSKKWTSLPNIDYARIGKASFWEKNVLPHIPK